MKIAAFLSTGSAIALLGVPAFAQAPPSRSDPNPAGTTASAGTEELAAADGDIIVTAERRATSLQKLPASAVALSGEALKDRGVTDLSNLQSQVPSLSFVDVGNVKFVNIRGIGISEGAPNQTVGVAVHLDGAYIAREFTIGDSFFDLDRVEVLRGPQGTYVGQNSTGGAVFIESRAPRLGKMSGFAEAVIASYGRHQIGAGMDIPIGKTLAVRLSGEAEEHNSYYRNRGANGLGNVLSGGNSPGDLHRLLGRAQVLWQPDPSLTARLIYQYSDRRSDGTTFQLRDPAQPLDTRRTLNYDFAERLNTQYSRTTGIVDWQAIDAFKVRVVASHQRTHQYFQEDTDRSSPQVTPALPQSTNAIDMRDRYTTAEIDLVSTGDGPFQWTIGGTLLDYKQPFTLQSTSYNTAAAPSTTPNLNSGLFLYFDTLRQNRAVFGEVGYDLTPTLNVKVGGRYNHDKVGIRGDSYLTPPLAAPMGGPNGTIRIPAGPNEPTYDAFTGRVLANWQVTPDHLLYATVSRGYKPGGWTPNLGGPPTPDNVYGAERVTNYELGWKSTLFQGAMRNAISAYYMDYAGFQATIATDPNNPATSVTKNVDGTKIKGVEVQTAISLGRLLIDGGLSYNDAKYGNLSIFQPAGIFGPNNPAAPVQINLNGRTISFAPKVSANAAISYTIALPAGRLMPRIQFYHIGGQWANFYQAPYSFIPARTTAEAHLTYIADARWKVDAYVTNLFGKDYISAISGSSRSYVGSYLLGPPREAGARLSYSF